MVNSKSMAKLRSPRDIFNEMHSEYGFTTIVAESSKLIGRADARPTTPEALAEDWSGKTVFCYPPIKGTKEWVEKCKREGEKPDTTVVLLTQAKTETTYFHDFIAHKAEIHFFQGRLELMSDDAGGVKRTMYGPMVAIFRGPLTEGIKPIIVEMLHERILTAGEIHKELVRRGYRQRINSITSRLSQLAKAGRIRAVGKRVCTVTGNVATAWVAVEVL